MKIVLNGILLRYSDLRAVPIFQTLLTMPNLTHCLTTFETNYLNRRARLADRHTPCVECHTLALSTQTSDANIKTVLATTVAHCEQGFWLDVFQ